MTSHPPATERAHASVDELVSRMRRTPGLLERTAALELPAIDLRDGLVTTGVGMSETIARFVAAAARAQGIAAEMVPVSTFLGAGPTTRAHLMVFSQELSATVAGVLERSRCSSSTVVTSTLPSDPRLAGFIERGGTVCQVEPPSERGFLVRVMGPRTSALAGLRLISRTPVDGRALSAAVQRAFEAGSQLHVDDARPTMLTEGRWAEACVPLSWAWMEALWVDAPLISDALHFVHGAWQARHDGCHDVIALRPIEHADELWNRVKALVSSSLNRLHFFDATLPAPLAFFEFAAFIDGLIASKLRRAPVELERWPGQGTDAVLYGWSGQ